MRHSTLVCSLLGSQVLATPYASLPVSNGYGALVIRGSLVERQHVSVSVDCNRLVEQVIGYISAYPDYASAALGVTMGTGTAYTSCRYFNGQNCVYLAGMVSNSLGLVVWASKMTTSPKSEGAQTMPATKRDLDAYHQRLQGELGSYLSSRGLTFESISGVQEEGGSLSRRGNGQSEPHTLHIRGLGNSKDGTKSDHKLTFRNDGQGGLVEISLGDSPADHAKRGSSKGFKISYSVTEVGLGVPQHAGYDYLCYTAAEDWAWRAENDRIGDYIGQFDLGGSGKVQFRIIPENVAFEDNYEDVSKCNA